MNNVIIVKRDGTQVPYDRNKIICAINKALLEIDGNIYSGYISENVATSIESYFDYHTVECITVEEIQDLVEWNLINGPKPELAKALSPMYPTQLGISKFVKLVHPRNAYLLIVVIW